MALWLSSVAEPAGGRLSRLTGHAQGQDPRTAPSRHDFGPASTGLHDDPANIWSRAYLDPHHDDILINEYPLVDAPGTRIAYSDATADLVAVVIERATGARYVAFFSEQVLKPLGAVSGAVCVDRSGALAHAGCCILLPARTWMKLGLLVLQDGR